MTASHFSPDTLHANAVIALRKARDGLAKLEAELSDPATESRRHWWLKAQITRKRNRIADLEAALASFNTENDDMRRSNIEEPLTTNSPEHPWRCQRSLTFGDRTYRRGEVIDDAIVNSAANVVGLINGGHIRRMPAPVSTPAPAAVAALTAKPNAVTPSDPVRECRAALKAAAAKRGCSWRSALDVIDRGLVERAIQAIAFRDGKGAHRPVDAAYIELCTEEG